MKKLVLFGLLVSLNAMAFAQQGWKWPEDVEKAKENNALYADAVKSKDFVRAQEPHQWLLDNAPDLNKSLYINGAKQTGYFWELLGICELVFGLLLIIQGTSFIGAVLLLPITLHIFLFHAFLELDEIGELIMTGGLLLANLILVFKEYSNWKHLIWIKVF